MARFCHPIRLILACGVFFYFVSNSPAAAPDKSGVKPNVISLPSGPGSIEGLGDAFQPQVNTGTATYGVPLRLPPGAAGFAPSLALSYNSGSGNSSFGQGWNCGPALVIERQTEKGFPRYRDTDAGAILRDTFVFGAEELVPLSDGTYRCENEAGFRRFTPIASQGIGIDAWLVEDPQGTKHWLGRYLGNAPNGESSRIVSSFPPADDLGSRTSFNLTYAWHEDAAEDVNGNRIEYYYSSDASSPGMLYLDEIRYFAKGNAANYHFAKFYYETRPDKFSDNRAGFLRIIGSRCREIGVGSHYDGAIHPVRSYVLSYRPTDGALGDLDANSPIAQKRIYLGLSFLFAVTQFDSTRGLGGVGDIGNYLPPMRLAYAGFYLQAPPASVLQALEPLNQRLRTNEPSPLATGPLIGTLIQKADPDSAVVPSIIFDVLLENPHVHFADMNADGLPDLLNTETDQTHPSFRVAYNYGNGVFKTSGPVTNTPPGVDLADSSAANSVTLKDSDGNGVTDLVQIVDVAGTLKTRIRWNLHEPSRADGPTGFAASPSTDATTPPEVLLSSPAVRQMDINSDKRPDVLVCNQQGLVGYRADPGGGWSNLGRQDWSQAPGDGRIPSSYCFSRIDPPLAERPNPLVQLADMNGDRLLDLVQIVVGVNGEASVNYRPLVGPMAWGTQVTLQFAQLDGTPSGSVARLSLPGLLSDPLNSQNNWDSIQMLDVNGDGLTDVVYVEQNQSLRVFFNCAGQAFLGPFRLLNTPIYQPYDGSNPTILRTVDINGNGSTDLVFYHGLGGADRRGFRFVDFSGGQKPGLLQVIDNGIGRRTFIRYRHSTDDLIRSRRRGKPWLTTMPNPVWVVAGMVDDIGLDLNGDAGPDYYVASFDYRDGYYDGFEKQFRGFAYVQKIVWGDDVDSGTGLPTGNGLGAVSGPTAVTRYRFMTGSPDGTDNDQYVDGIDTETRPPELAVDETTDQGGREEESMKGNPVWEEAIDGSALIDPVADFDLNASATGSAARSGDPYGPAATHSTPDKYVYSRVHSQWAVRRLYRPANVVVPKGRFLIDEPGKVSLVAKSVTYPVLLRTITETIEANELLREKFNHANAPVASRGAVVSAKDFDYDNFGNPILERDHGVISGLTPPPDDERTTRRSFILSRGGNGSIDRWIVNRVQNVRIEDENGVFVAETRSYYDGSPFAGLPSGQIGVRGLVSRTEQRVRDPSFAAPSLDHAPDTPQILAQLKVPSDPRPEAPEWIQSSRAAYDDYGNQIGVLDPIGRLTSGYPDVTAGHFRELVYDLTFHSFPMEERIHVGGGKAPLIIRAEYLRSATLTRPEVPWGFAAITRSHDFNNNPTEYFYDSFARPVALVRPGDSEELPTIQYTYRPADPHRGWVYEYNRAGALITNSGQFRAIANAVQSDAREVAGRSGVFTTITYTDGSKRKLVHLEEDETNGVFVVKEAVRYNLSGGPLFNFQPYRQTGSGFLLPPLTSPRTDLFTDAMGRVIKTVTPPETVDSPSQRLESRVHYRPLTVANFDSEDLAAADPGAPHLNTPIIHYKDGLGRLTGVDEVVRNAGDGTDAFAVQTWQTRYEYTLHDKLALIRDSQNNQKWMRYDGLGRQIFMNDCDRGTVRDLFDDAGNEIETIDAKGQRITYTYDGANRILTEDYHDEGQGLPFSAERRFNPDQPISTTNRPDVAYFYDSPSANLPQGDNTAATARNTRGTLAYVLDLSGEEHTSYDSRGRVEYSVKRIPEPLFWTNRAMPISPLWFVSYKTGFEYDSLDRVIRLTYPDLDQVSYEYNDRSLLKRIPGGPNTNVISNLSYTASGQQRQIDYGNGVRTTYGYDSRLRLTNLFTFRTQPGTNDPQLINLEYDFDGVSNIRAIHDRRPGTAVPAGDPRRNTQIFQYDDLYRLTQVQYSFGLPGQPARNDGHIDYRYDRIGNMLKQISDIVHNEKGLPVANLGLMDSGGIAGRFGRMGRTATDPPGPHALTRITQPSTTNSQARQYPYDANGNMTDIDGLRCTWDLKDRLVAVENEEMRADYTYDFTDRRITKRVVPKFPRPQGDEVANSITEPFTTVYVGKHFEVRENDAPTKYVWNGDTRVARVTGDLSTSNRIQRLRLWTGWNLVSLAVSGSQVDNLGSPITAGLRWNQITLGWDAVAPNDSLPAGTILWIQAPSNAVIRAVGLYPGPLASTRAPTEGAFLPCAGLEVWNPGFSRLTNASLWKFNPVDQAWLSQLSFPFTQPSTLNPQLSKYTIAPGESVFTKSTQSSDLTQPDFTFSIQYYHQDHLGSSTLLSDADALPVEEVIDYPFGYIRQTFRPRGIREHYQFTQKEQDLESNLHYFEARCLASGFARFLSVDPLLTRLGTLALELPQSHNAYVYSMGNPIRYVDPDGTSPKDWLIAAGEALTAGGKAFDATSDFAVNTAKTLDPKKSLHDRLGAGSDLLKQTVKLTIEHADDLGLKLGLRLGVRTLFIFSIIGEFMAPIDAGLGVVNAHEQGKMSARVSWGKMGAARGVTAGTFGFSLNDARAGFAPPNEFKSDRDRMVAQGYELATAGVKSAIRAENRAWLVEQFRLRGHDAAKMTPNEIMGLGTIILAPYMRVGGDY